MNKQKRYTAQEMRDMAQCLQYNFPCSLYKDAAYMLRQAADFLEQANELPDFEMDAIRLSGSTIILNFLNSIRG